jgi:succinate-acetate transporter protein
MTTVILNFKNAGIIEMSPMIIGMGFFFRRHCSGYCRHYRS